MSDLNRANHYDLTNAETRVNLRHVFTVGVRDAVDAFLEADEAATKAYDALQGATSLGDVTEGHSDAVNIAEATRRYATEALRATTQRLKRFEKDCEAAVEASL